MNPDCPVYSEIHEFLSSFDAKAVAETRRDRSFQRLRSPTIDPDWAARIWIATEPLRHAIEAYRLDVLRQDSSCDRPRPYCHPALKDLVPDEEHLLPLHHFTFDGARLLRNGHAFLVLSTTGAPNSTYWLNHACHSNDVQNHVRVRLDPLLHGPAQEFFPLRQAMHVYGRSLDWNRIKRLRCTEHGKWSPDSHGGPTRCTEYAWEPRRSEVSFVCEEVPTLGAASRRPGRYFHSIYHPSEASISHLDGAVRIYADSDIVKRHTQHVRNAGKLGLRAKVFRIDKPLSRTVLSSLCQTFFVWNRDVLDYFGGGCK